MRLGLLMSVPLHKPSRNAALLASWAAVLSLALCGLSHGASEAAEGFVVSGVIVFEGGTGLAWLQEPTITGNQVVAVRAGESVGPYRLTRILKDRIELEGPGGKVLVPIHNARGASGTAAGPEASRPGSAPAGAPASEPPGSPETGKVSEARAPAAAASPSASTPAVNIAPDDSRRGRAIRGGGGRR